MPDTPTQPPDPIAELRRKIAQRELLLQDSPDDDLLLASLAKLKEQLNQINASTISATNVVSGLQYNDHRTTNIFEAAKPAPAEDLEARYLRGLRKRLTRLPLGDSDDDAQGVTLESVYIALDTTERIKLTGAEQQAYKDKQKRVPDDRAVTCQEAIALNKRVVLLGDPGSGKSSFVNQLAAALAQARLDEKQAKPTQPPAGLQAKWLPLVMTLRDLVPKLPTLPENCDPATQARQLRAAVWAQWDEELAKDKAEGFRSALESKLEAGEAVLIFDGLDEVAEAARSRVRDAVRALLHEYPKISHVVITCRTRSYSDTLFANYKKYEVAKFDEDKIRHFVKQWYAVRADAADAADAKVKADELTEAVLEQSLRELAENPMLLTTMALLHSRDQGRLPKERAKLYDRAINLLLERWQKKGIAVSPALKSVLADTAKLREMARELAYQAHTLQQKQKDADLERGFLLALLEQPHFLGTDGPVREFLDYVDQRAGLLIGLGGDEVNGGQPKTYKFPHRTFQEYLAGCWLVAQRPRDTLLRYEQCAQADDYWTLAAQLGAEDLLHNRDRKTDVADLAYKLLRANAQTAADWRCTLWSGKLAALLSKEQVLADTDPYGGAAYLQKLLPQLNTLITENKLPALERAEAGKLIGKLADLHDPLFGYAFDVDQIYKDLCVVPGGEFWMGSADDDKTASDRERPRHLCNVSGFRIARFPVSNAQFAQFVVEDGEPAADYGEPFNLPNHPVVGVSWYQAVAFCEWLTLRWHTAGLMGEDEAVRLPTEVEWERAARGGLDGTDFGWGHSFERETLHTWMNVYETGLRNTSALGCFQMARNPYGLEEVSGNVWEWTSSLYGQWNTEKSKTENVFGYPYDSRDGREDLSRDTTWRRVLRGGSWVSVQQDARVASRNDYAPDNRFNSFGFRLVCAPVLPPPASGNLSSGFLGR